MSNQRNNDEETKNREVKPQDEFLERGDEVLEGLRQDPEHKTLKVFCKKNESESRALARVNTTPEVIAAESIRAMSENEAQPMDINDLVAELEDQSFRLKSSTDRAESTLASQANTLDAMFHMLTRRGVANIKAGHGQMGNEYLKLAMKAQSQCRTTVEAVANMRRPVIKQTNIAHGHQQVNNNPPNKLMESQNDERLDPGTPSEAVKGDQALETVEEEHRTQDGERKG